LFVALLLPLVPLAVRRCSAAPALAAANSISWSPSCADTPYGTECKAPCATNAFGDGYSAKCTGTDTWTYSSNGSCTVKACQGIPPDRPNSDFISEFGSAWYMMDKGNKVPCNGNLLNTICSADCAASTSGTAFKAECKPVAGGSNQWVTWGGCTGESGMQF
jgi:hypothetical protein